MLISEEKQDLTKEIEIVQTCEDPARACDPEDLFDMIEKCKICGKWI